MEEQTSFSLSFYKTFYISRMFGSNKVLFRSKLLSHKTWPLWLLYSIVRCYGFGLIIPHGVMGWKILRSPVSARFSCFLSISLGYLWLNDSKKTKGILNSNHEFQICIKITRTAKFPQLKADLKERRNGWTHSAPRCAMAMSHFQGVQRVQKSFWQIFCSCTHRRRR